MDCENSRYVRTEEWKKERANMIRFIINQKMATLTYEDLSQLGLNSVMVYQETYNKQKYRSYHPKGKKSSSYSSTSAITTPLLHCAPANFSN
jgi:hypothetical protein